MRKMIGNANLISCNFRAFVPYYRYRKNHETYTSLSSTQPPKFSNLTINHSTHTIFAAYYYVKNYNNNNILLFCSKRSVSDDPEVDNNVNDVVESGRDDWTTSILLFLFWAALIYYLFNLAPNQTPSTDIYFLKKLSNLVGDDGFRMNQVLVSLWYIMGLWPIVYSMLLLPSARSSKSSIPVWPFVSLSFFGGAYALIPYFILWRPPPPPVKEDEVRSWPLNFLESKITAGIVGAAGLGLIVYAGLGYNDWKEFYQYFSSSKLVHATSLDFSLLSAFAPFWVYNDMTARKCYDKTAWLLPLSIVPFVGPVLYLLLRPPLTTLPVSLETTLKSD